MVKGVAPRLQIAGMASSVEKALVQQTFLELGADGVERCNTDTLDLSLFFVYRS